MGMNYGVRFFQPISCPDGLCAFVPLKDSTAALYVIAIGHKAQITHPPMRNNVQRTGVEFVFCLEASIPGMAGYVDLEVAHLHGGGLILTTLL